MVSIVVVFRCLLWGSKCAFVLTCDVWVVLLSGLKVCCCSVLVLLSVVVIVVVVVVCGDVVVGIVVDCRCFLVVVCVVVF